MDKQTLKAYPRTLLGRKVKQLRKQGKIPANISGKHVKSTSVEVNLKEFETVFHKAGETGIVEIQMDKGTHPVLIHNISHHPVSSAILHVDFLEVNLKEKVTTNVPVALVGEAQAIKDKVGVLLTLIHEVSVEALPMDLPEKIEVAVSHLAQVGDTLKISDVKIPATIKILTPADTDIVKVAPLVSKEAQEMAAQEAAAAAASAAAATPEGGEAKPAAEAAPSEKKEEAPKK